jgi:hypothetical protein
LELCDVDDRIKSGNDASLWDEALSNAFADRTAASVPTILRRLRATGNTAVGAPPGRHAPAQSHHIPGKFIA